MRVKSLLNALQNAKFERILDKKDAAGWDEYLNRQFMIPSVDSAVLAIEFKGKAGPWRMWVKYQLIGDLSHRQVMQEAIWLPNCQEHALEPPEEVDGFFLAKLKGRCP